MAKRGSTRKLRLFGRVYSPLKHLIQATRNVSKSVFTRTGKVVDQGLGLVEDVGNATARHANMAVRNMTGKRKANRKNTRKGRKSASRKNRK
jgi:hypothetical protein